MNIRITLPPDQDAFNRLVDDLPVGGTIEVKIDNPNDYRQITIRCAKPTYTATKTSVGRALLITDDRGWERTIVLGQPCPHHEMGEFVWAHKGKGFARWVPA